MKKHIIEYTDKVYPQKLKFLKKPPARIYTIGNIELLNENGMAVVGSRTNTNYGKKMCEKFTKEIVEYGLTIISGLAIGIDSIAHSTCLKYSGKTIAVLPSGLKNIYPTQNIELANKIIENGGLIISEYEDNIKADSKKFLERNRIVAALGLGTLVIEAGYRSGTSVTANYTTKLGKKVFCIPSSLENNKGIITNELIKKGGMLVTNIEDIINQYKDISLKKICFVEKNIKHNVPNELLEIYKLLSKSPKDINKISYESKKSIQEVSYKITLLQLENFIQELPGKRYIIKEDEEE